MVEGNNSEEMIKGRGPADQGLQAESRIRER
jgi:hypothetical protein